MRYGVMMWFLQHCQISTYFICMANFTTYEFYSIAIFLCTCFDSQQCCQIFQIRFDVMTSLTGWATKSTKRNRPRGIRRARWSRGWSSSTFICLKTRRISWRFTSARKASKAETNWLPGNPIIQGIFAGFLRDFCGIFAGLSSMN